MTHSEQFFQCRLVLAHVLIGENYPFLRKKLFLFMARTSTGLCKNND
jgi:hypothetical protein